MMGLIPDTLNRLKRVRVFTPNVHYEWQQEENERSFLEWCRTDEVTELRPDTTPQDVLTGSDLIRFVKSFLP